MRASQFPIHTFLRTKPFMFPSKPVCELSFLSYAERYTICLCLVASLCRMLQLVAHSLSLLFQLYRIMQRNRPKGQYQAWSLSSPLALQLCMVLLNISLIADFLLLLFSFYIIIIINIISFVFMVQLIVINNILWTLFCPKLSLHQLLFY